MDRQQLETDTGTPLVRRARCARWKVRLALAAGFLLFCLAAVLGLSWALKKHSVDYSEGEAIKMAQLAGAAYCSRSSLEALETRWF